MKKYLFISKLFSLCLILLFSQYLLGQKSQRMVLLEQFTNVSCSPCASVNPGIVTLHNTNATKMALIFYHVNWPSASDPMYTVNPSEISNRINYYTVNSVPKSALDGVVLSGAPSQTNINTNYAVASPFDVQMTHEVVNGIITVKMVITKTASTTGTLIAQIAVIEELMTYGSAPGSNGETQFHNVFKKFLPNQNGTTLNNLNVGQSQTITKSWTYTNVLDMTKLKAVGFIQNNSSKAVLQAAMSTAATNIPPGADFKANTTTPCTGEVNFTDLSSYVTAWSWNFGDGGTSTQQNPTHTYTANGTYTVSLTVTNNGVSSTETKTSYITLSMPSAPTTTNASGNYGSSVTLQASGAGTLRWYSDATGGTPIYSGTSYTTPQLYTTTNYYVEDNIFDPLQHVGKVNKETSAGGYFSANDVRGLYFSVYKPCLIKSVKLYVDTAGKRIIEVLQGEGGSVVQTKTINNVPSGEQRVTLDFQMDPGTDYFIKCKKTNGAIVDLWRDNANATYPQTLNGVLSITNSNAGSAGYWYYFYDWEVQGGPCISPRAIVTANISVGIEENDNSIKYSLYPNPNNGEFTLNLDSQQNENIEISISDINGKILFSSPLNISGEKNKKFNFSNYSKGIYFIKLVSKQKVYNEKLIIK